MTPKERSLVLFIPTKYVILSPKLHHEKCHRITHLDTALRRCLLRPSLSSRSLLDNTVPDGSSLSLLWKMAGAGDFPSPWTTYARGLLFESSSKCLN